MCEHVRTTTEERKVHPQHGQAGQRRRNNDSEPHNGEHVYGAVDEELLSDEAECSWKASAGESHRQEADRQHWHALIAAVICS
jgi:hypothetical protein